MIILTRYNDGTKLYIDETSILRVTDGHDLVGARSFPYTEVELDHHDSSDNSETDHTVLRVIESARNIGKLMIEATHRRRVASETAKHNQQKT